MNSLYLLLNIGTIVIPLLMSFHPRYGLKDKTRVLVCAIGISAVFFILWDIWFAKQEVWGFNPGFLIGFSLFGLPLEEWIFFLTIPYASLFLHYNLYYAQLRFPSASVKVARGISLVLLVIALIAIFIFHNRIYTLINLAVFILTLSIYVRYFLEDLSKFYVSFALILLPFVLVNGTLTGSFTTEPVVWYSENQLMGLRVLRIPIEDFFYAFSLLAIPQMIFYKGAGLSQGTY